MELTSRMKMAGFQTFWIQMRKNNPLDENRKTGQTSGTKMAFYSFIYDSCTYHHDYQSDHYLYALQMKPISQ
ncbi:hypothetical protein Hanom_Chr17g01531541 [Helianthus anomalus]